MTNTEVEKYLEEMAAKIGEHFGAVQIMVSWLDDKGRTSGCKKGVGDWYARQGMAHEFINEDVAFENARQIAQKLEPPPDDSWKAV
jgi:hypothetical protein